METTQKAIVEAEVKSLGIIPDDASQFSSVEDAMKDLEK